MENVVTFWRQDATLLIPQFQWDEGDIYFQFRTTTESGTFLNGRGLADANYDELKATLISPTELQLMWYSSGGGEGVKSISLHLTRPLNDNQWHSVLIERNRKEVRLRVDGTFSVDLPNSQVNYRPLQLGDDLVIGASGDLSAGYVGCLRSLLVNGVLYNLRGVAELSAYGLHPGCVGKCATYPCMNDGVCLERYDAYRCDCRFTAFRGPLCSDEIGAHFRAEDQVEYHFTNNVISTVHEHIHVGFVTTEPRGILMQIMGADDEYISVEMSNAGTIRVALDVGFQRQELYEESQYYPNGQFHHVHVWRTNEGRTVNLQVDEHEVVSRTFRIGHNQDAQLNGIHTIYIGRNNSMREREGFIGCLSRVSFEDYFILKLLFQQQPPDNVKSNRRLREDWCDVQPATYPPEVVPVRPDVFFRSGREGAVSHPVLLESDQSDIPDQTVLTVVLVVVSILVGICLLLLVKCYLARKNDHADEKITTVHASEVKDLMDNTTPVAVESVPSGPLLVLPQPVRDEPEFIRRPVGRAGRLRRKPVQTAGAAKLGFL